MPRLSRKRVRKRVISTKRDIICVRFVRDTSRRDFAESGNRAARVGTHWNFKQTSVCLACMKFNCDDRHGGLPR